MLLRRILGTANIPKTAVKAAEVRGRGGCLYLSGWRRVLWPCAVVVVVAVALVVVVVRQPGPMVVVMSYHC